MRLALLTDDDGDRTDYTYDWASRVTQINYPDVSSTGAHVVRLSYDVSGNAVTRTDQNGVAATLAYNDLHRLASRRFRRDGAVVLAEGFEYDRSGRMLAASNGFATVEFAYDGLGRLRWTSQEQGGPPLFVEYDYAVNTNGQPSTRTVTYPGGRRVVDTFDLRGRLTGVDSWPAGGSGEPDAGGTWAYDLANRMTGAALGNGVTTAFDHDVDDRLTGIEHAKDATALFHVDYGYDAVGNRLWTDNVLRPDRSEKYFYDNRDRLQIFKRGPLDETKSDVPTPLAHPSLDSLSVISVTSC